jgi:hypothetical protein
MFLCVGCSIPPESPYRLPLFVNLSENWQNETQNIVRDLQVKLHAPLNLNVLHVAERFY